MSHLRHGLDTVLNGKENNKDKQGLPEFERENINRVAPLALSSFPTPTTQQHLASSASLSVICFPSGSVLA